MADPIDTPAQEQPALETSAVIARQAILDEKREVYGFELFDRSVRSDDNHTAASDAAMLFNALSFVGTDALAGKKTVFINCTHDSLAGGHLELIHPDKVVLEIPPLDGGTPESIAERASVLAQLKARGFRLAFDQAVLKKDYASWLPLAAYVKLDLTTFKPEQAGALVKYAKQACPGATLVAEKVETAEQFEKMRELGVKLFQGFWFQKPQLIKTQSIAPSQATIIQLINLVRRQADTSEIEELLKKDPTLSFNLLRFINSAGFGLSVEVTSFKHAVLILGLQKLFRWAALLMTTSRAGGAAPAAGATAVVRGRLMELLAAELLPKEEADNAFVVGVFSLLDTMLGVPLDRALQSVTLPQPVTDALLHRKGPYAPFLELTLACETADDAVFARLADQLKLSNHQINWSHLQALAWAENMAA